MILQRVLFVIAGAAALATAAAVGVVAAACALYAFLAQYVTPALDYAILTGTVALIFLIVGLVAVAKARFKAKPASLGERLADFVREKPVAAAAAGLAAAFFAARNPKMLMALVLAFLEPKAGKRP